MRCGMVDKNMWDAWTAYMSLKRYISLKRYKLHACELAIPAFSLCLQGMMGSKVSYCQLCWKISVKTTETIEIFQYLQV
jgi:hypothetical protein